MIKNVYCVHDSKAQAFDRPVLYRTRAEAIRAFQDGIKETNSPFNKYPEDFTLFEIGQYDELTGALIPFEAKIAVGNGLELKQ